MRRKSVKKKKPRKKPSKLRKKDDKKLPTKPEAGCQNFWTRRELKLTTNWPSKFYCG